MSYLDELFSLQGKTAIVTGGGRGIGQVVAIGLAKAGADIVIFSRTGAEETVGLITEQGGQAISMIVDVTDEAMVKNAMDDVYSRFSSIDVVFNNAGICIHKDTLASSADEWRQVLDINLTGQFIVARAAARIMIENGIRGSIINMASMSGSIVNIPQMQASYNSSKAGVIHLSKSLAVEFAKYGIRVNSLSPGYINTPMSSDTPQELKDAWMPLIPMYRMGEPEELIGAVIYLAADTSGYTTGLDMIVDGAYTCL